MGNEVDRLELQVEAQATKANNQLDKLVGKLDAVANSLSHINTSGLTGLANGVQKFAQASSQLSSVKTADFTRLTKNIDKLSALNTQQIFSASSAITTLSKAVDGLGSVSGGSAQLASVVNSVSALGGANVQRAVVNLPALANALNSFMATMSRAPEVSQNIIRMTNALASLAAQGGNVRAAGNLVARSTDNVGNVMSRNVGRINSFSMTLQSLARIYTLVKRGAQKLWTSIESSMSYVETLNYFDAAYGQVAEKAVAQWADMGAASAEEYYNSFSKRAKELTSKMTGFSVNDDGTLTATGQASLGINPNQLMNYQAMFAQMSSSMGIASETSLKLSQALTEIGGDLASVKNMDFDKVWQDMASGLAGMSRTLDKYGVNIRNVNLQQKLMELGIDENITALNQNDKALLRAIILLDSTRYAWGDLADTINQPANQIRLLESNWANLSRTIGNIFLPVVAKVLPYVNGLVIAVQRLFTWIGSLLGLDLSQITSTVGSGEFDFGDLISDTDDLTGSLNDASKAADKLKKGIRAFDELNVITTSDDSGNSALSGLGGIGTTGLLDAAFDDIFNEYQAKWDEAFAKMQNKANEIADKIEQFFQPLKDIFNDFAAGDFFKAGQDTSKLVAGIFNFFADAIDRVDWYRIGQKVGDFIAGIDWIKVLGSVGHLIWEALKAAIELSEGLFDAAPIETGIVAGFLAIKWLKFDKKIKKWAEEWAGKIMATLGTKLSATVAGQSIGFVPTVIISAVTWVVGFNAGKSLGKALFPDDVIWYDDFHWFGDGGFFEAISEDWKISLDALKNMIGDGLKSIFNWDNTLDIFDGAGFFFDKISEDFANRDWAAIGEDILGGICGGITGALSFITEPITDLFDFIWNGICNIFGIHSPAKEMEPIGENIVLGILDGFSLVNFAKKMSEWWDTSVSPWFTLAKWKELGENQKKSLSDKWSEFTTWFNGDGTSRWWSNIDEKFSDSTWGGFGENVKDALSSKWNSFTSWYNNTGFATWWRGVQEKFSKDKWTFSGISDGLKRAWSNAIEGIKILWNRFANWLNDKLMFEWDEVTIMGQQIVPSGSIQLGKIPTFSIGGFPEDGLFMANHGELVGQFSNGKTAVANNEQIIAGIEEAAYRGMARALSESGGNANVDIHVDGDPHGMFKVWKEEWNQQTNRTQKNPVRIY